MPPNIPPVFALLNYTAIGGIGQSGRGKQDGDRPASPVVIGFGLWHWTVLDKKNNRSKAVHFYSVVPRVGLEPTHLAAGDFESPASTNFATWAGEEDAIIAISAAL